MKTSAAAKLPRLLTVKAVSEATMLPVSTLYDAIYQGQLPCYRFGRAVRLNEAEVRRWIDNKLEE